MSQVIYRSARKEEAQTIVGFQLAMALETESFRLDQATVEEGVRAVFESPEKGRYYVIEKENRVIGSLMILGEWSDWRNRNVWWIHSVYIVPDERGNGYFSGLYEYIKKLAQKDSAVGGLRLYVEKKNTAAQAVYKKLGMNSEHYSLFEWMKDF